MRIEDTVSSFRFFDIIDGFGEVAEMLLRSVSKSTAIGRAKGELGSRLCIGEKQDSQESKCRSLLCCCRGRDSRRKLPSCGLDMDVVAPTCNKSVWSDR